MLVYNKDKRADIAEVLSLEFNTEKCHYIAFSKMCNSEITPMSLGRHIINWCETVKYLGVYLQCGKSVKFDINPVKRPFYAACNTMFLHSSGVNEIALLHLQET